MNRDPIVDEVRKAREDYGRKFDFDLEAMIRDLRDKQAKSGRQLVSFPPRVCAQEKRSTRGGRT